ncbi:MAG: hypothetical protein ACP6IS_12680 [Candidatus Asgardarchaeia archaeon]
MAKTCENCKYAGQVDATMVWCTKKNIYVSKQSAETCEFYEPK